MRDVYLQFYQNPICYDDSIGITSSVYLLITGFCAPFWLIFKLTDSSSILKIAYFAHPNQSNRRKHTNKNTHMSGKSYRLHDINGSSYIWWNYFLESEMIGTFQRLDFRSCCVHLVCDSKFHISYNIFIDREQRERATFPLLLKLVLNNYNFHTQFWIIERVSWKCSNTRFE